jgi:hypothetical protein
VVSVDDRMGDQDGIAQLTAFVCLRPDVTPQGRDRTRLDLGRTFRIAESSRKLSSQAFAALVVVRAVGRPSEN